MSQEQKRWPFWFIVAKYITAIYFIYRSSKVIDCTLQLTVPQL